MSEVKPTELAENQKKVVEKKEPTPEEIAAYEAKRMAFMKQKLPFLKVEAQYTKLMAEIEENHARELFARIQYAQKSAEITKMQQSAPDPEKKPTPPAN